MPVYFHVCFNAENNPLDVDYEKGFDDGSLPRLLDRNNEDDSDDYSDDGSLPSLGDRFQNYGSEDDSDEEFYPPKSKESKSKDGDGEDGEPSAEPSDHHAMKKNKELLNSVFKMIKKEHPLKNMRHLIGRKEHKKR